MMNPSMVRSLAIAIGIGLLPMIGAGSAEGQGLRAFVLNNDSLITIDTAQPAAASLPTVITGLNAGDRLVGIDFRSQNGYLYGLGLNSQAGAAQLYLISYRNGVASPVGVTGTFVAADGSTPVPIQGLNFGVDVDATADRLRVVNDAGQNFRIDLNTGAFIDGDLGGSIGSVPGLNMDGPINGAATSVVAAASTNHEQNATVTTLYTLSAATHTLCVQNAPKSGTETVPKAITLNGAPLAFDAFSGFDIPPGVDVSANNAGAVGNGFAALTVDGVSSLYTIDLATGAATALGAIGNATGAIRGLAIQGEDVPGGLPSIALGANTLIRFNTATPATAVVVTVTGVVGGEALGGIDWRAKTGQLYGLGLNPGNGTGSATLYRLDPQTGVATIVGTANGVADGSGSPVNLGNADTVGFDVDPEFDRIKIVTNNGLNLSVQPDDSTVRDDRAVHGLPTGSTGVTGAAFTGSYTGNLFTGLRVLDPTSHELFNMFSQDAGPEYPWGGQVGSGVTVTIGGNPLNFTSANGFDIPPGVPGGFGALSIGFAVLTVGPVTSLYRINLATGAATEIGLVGGSPNPLRGLAVGDGPAVPTVTTLTSSPNPSAANQTVTFTATVTPAIATGTVDLFQNFNVVPGCLRLPVINGTATCTLALSLGTVGTSATYNGDSTHGVSRSALVIQQVIGNGTTPTTTTLAVTPEVASFNRLPTVTASVTPIAATGAITFFSDDTPIETVAVVNGTASPSIASLQIGSHSLSAVYSGDDTFAGSTSAHAPLTLMNLRRRFAEGATGSFFHTDLGLFNTSRTSGTQVQVTLLPESGPSTILPPVALDPLGRTTVDINAALPEASGVAIVVESDQIVATSRQLTWGQPVYGSTLESGTTGLSTDWIFAEGATNTFSLFYLIENPNDRPANVTLTHLLEGGAAPVVQTDVVPPFTRRTLFINDVPGLRSAALSTVIHADQGIVAERAMYLNTTNRLWEGGTVSLGTYYGGPTWYFAEGATGSFFHTYLLLGNFQVDTETVTVKYLLSDGTVITKTYDVPGQARRTVDIPFEDPQLRSASFGMIVTSRRVIVAERAMWWGEPWTDGSASAGAVAPGLAWAIGEGIEGGANEESTFVLVMNTSSGLPTVRLTVSYDDGTHEQKDYDMGRNGRLTVRVGDDFPHARDHRFSVLVESLLGDPITVEYARYQSPSGTFGDGGGAALATRIR